MKKVGQAYLSLSTILRYREQVFRRAADTPPEGEESRAAAAHPSASPLRSRARPHATGFRNASVTVRNGMLR